VPDIAVKFCTDTIESALGRKYRYDRQVALQPMFAIASLLIEHPDKVNDADAMNLAGVESALRVYEKLLALRPDARLGGLDDLVAKRERGELRGYVEQVARKSCKS